MQRTFTVELRVDFNDPEKIGHMKHACQIAARHLMAQAALIKDAVNPQIAVHSEDFYSGREEIGLFEDVLGQGVAMMGEAGESEQISAELMAALNENNSK